MADVAGLAGWLSRTRSDLQSAAVSICPGSAEVLAALDGAPLARMSGSGATCFALHEGEWGALAQAARLRLLRPGWWIVVAPVEPMPRP